MSAPSRNGFPAVTAWHACAKLGSADGRPSRTSASAAAGPSARGRSGPSGAAASELREQVRLGRGLAGAHRADHGEPQLPQAAGELRQPP